MTEPKHRSNSAYSPLNTTGMAKTASVARYLPSTISVAERGRDASSWSVCPRLSPANERMASRGSRITSAGDSVQSEYSNAGLARMRFMTVKNAPSSKRKSAMMRYPVMP